MYVKVSVPKNADGAGAATVKNPTILIVDVEDIAKEPVREVGSSEIKDDYELAEGAKAVGIYATPSSIEITSESTGEADAHALIKGVVYDHPGDSVDIENHKEAYLNKGVIAFVRECDGGANGRVRVVGSLCNPLYMAPEYTNSKDGTKNHFVWKQEQGDKFGIATYAGSMPEVAAAAAAGNEGA